MVSAAKAQPIRATPLIMIQREDHGMSRADAFPLIRTQIAGVDVSRLAAQFGTPTYVYDSAIIEQRIRQLQAFDVVRYAQKANSNLAVLDLVRRQGALVDTVSAGEIRRALTAGFPLGGNPPAIVYTADIFDRESLAVVEEHGVHCNCGSPDMIDQLGSARPGQEITLRINPGFGHGHSQKTNTGGPQSKHGIWHEQLGDCVQRGARYDLQVTGLHVHIGSGTDLEHLAQVCGAVEQLAHQVGDAIHSISVGGGLPVPYRQDQVYVDLDRYFELCDSMRRRLEGDFGHSVSLEIEPGRFISAECGFLITEIRAVKRMGENTFYLVDAGFNDLARPVLYGAYHPMSISSNRHGDNQRTQDVVVGGPLCESGDIFTQEEGGYVCARTLPVAEVGDFLIIECAGAYGAVMASNYNSKPFAAEVLIRNGEAHVVRARQTFDDLIRGETIP